MKRGDCVLYEGCIGKVVNAKVNQECYTVFWFVNPMHFNSYQKEHFMRQCEVIPEDVAVNLVEVLKRNERSE